MASTHSARSVLPIVEAHRGDSAHAPENTMAAFRQAASLGARWIELDVHATRDGVPVVIHDARLERTTDGTGAVRDLTWEEISRLDAGSWRAPAFAGEPPARFVDVAQWAAASGVDINTEIKARSCADPVVRTLRDVGKESEWVVSSFDLGTLLDVRACAPELALALIGNGPECLRAALQHDLPWIHCQFRTATPDVVSRAHAAGIRVHIWTMDTPALYAHWARCGVDKVCTNRPGPMLRAAL